MKDLEVADDKNEIYRDLDEKKIPIGPIRIYMILTTAIPTLFGVLIFGGIVIILNYLIFRETGNLLQNANSREILDHLRKSTSAFHQQLTVILSTPLVSIMSMNELFFSENSPALDLTNGYYTPNFISDVDLGKIRLECKTAEITHKLLTKERIPKCILENHLNTYLFNIKDDLDSLTSLTNCTTLRISEEMGRGADIFSDLDKDIDELRNINSEIPYDVALILKIAIQYIYFTGIVIEDINIILGSYSSILTSGVMISQFTEIEDVIYNRLNYFKYKTDCSSRRDLYPSGVSYGYDPRCRPWATFVQSSLNDYLSSQSNIKYSQFESEYPIIITPPYLGALTNSTDVTICSPLTRKKKGTEEIELYFVSCVDIELNKIFEYLSQTILLFLIESEFVINSLTTLYKEQDFKRKTVESLKQKDYTRNFARKIISDLSLEGVPVGIILLYKKSYKHKYAGFSIYSNTMSIATQSAGKSDIKADKLLATNKMIEEHINSFLDAWNSKIMSECDEKNFIEERCSLALYPTEEFAISINNTQTGISEYRIVISTQNIFGKLFRLKDHNIDPFFKVCLVISTKIMQEEDLYLTRSINSLQLNILVGEIATLIIVMLFGGYALWSYSNRQGIALNSLIYFMRTEMKFNKSRDTDFDFQFQNEALEIRTLYEAFIFLNTIRRAALRIEKGFSQNDFILSYLSALDLFKATGNIDICATICTNLGNSYYIRGKFKKASNYYRSALKFTSESTPGSLVLLRQENLAQSIFYHLMHFEDSHSPRASYKELYRDNEEYEYLKEFEDLILTIRVHYIDHKDAYVERIRLMGKIVWSAVRMGRLGSALNALKSGEMLYKELKSLVQRKQNSDDKSAYIICYLKSEIYICRSEIYVYKGEYSKGAEKSTMALRQGKRYIFSLRKRALRILKKSLYLGGIRLSSSFLTFYSRNLEFNTEEDIDQVVFCLDYSGSMSAGNKIQNAINLILRIWDNSLRNSDWVGFIRFNLNIEIVFNIELKSSNTVQRRANIEMSLYPNDRTALFDALDLSLRLIERSKSQETRDKFIILISDGEDTSSKVDFQSISNNLLTSNVALIAIGMGLSKKASSKLIKLTQCTKKGAFFEFGKFGENNSDLIDSVSSFVKQIPIDDVNYEESLIY